MKSPSPQGFRVKAPSPSPRDSSKKGSYTASASSPRDGKRGRAASLVLPLCLVAACCLAGGVIFTNYRGILAHLADGAPCRIDQLSLKMLESLGAGGSAASLSRARMLLSKTANGGAALGSACECTMEVETAKAVQQKENEELKRKLKDLTAASAKQTETLRQLETDKSKVEADSQRVGKDVVKMRRQLAEGKKAADELAAVKLQLADKDKRVAALEKQVEAQVKGTDGALQKLLEHVKEKDAALDKVLGQTKEGCSADLQDAREKLSALTERVEMLRQERLTREATLSSARDKAAASEHAVQRLQLQLTSVREDLKSTQEDLEAAKALNSKQSAAETQGCAEEDTARLARAEAKVSELEKKLQGVEEVHCSTAGDAAAGTGTAEDGGEALAKAEARVAELEFQLREKATAGSQLAVGGQGANSEVVGYQCSASAADMARYHNYTEYGPCPNDWYFVQRLIFKYNCFALPRRRCRSVTPANPTEPIALPRSLFDQSALDDRNVRWDLHQCKSFGCLNTRSEGDCRNCFNMTLEEHRWKHPYRGTIPMAQVIAMKNNTLRLGLDAGGGTGSFAAHMARFGVTVMTTAFNVETVNGAYAGLPYHETISARGLIPLHVPHQSRLPLYDGILDVVHSVNSIKYIPLKQFEELLFEWDRVLRVRGIFWFEMFYAPVDEMPMYVEAIERMGYKKLYWKFTPKTDAAEVNKEHVYLNCILEKEPSPGKEVLTGPRVEDMKQIV